MRMHGSALFDHPKCVMRGGGISSGISEIAIGCRRRHRRSSSAWLMPAPARRYTQTAVVWCLDCGHQVEANPAEHRSATGPGTVVTDRRDQPDEFELRRPRYGSHRD